MSVNAKYLKDENGEVISPICSATTIYTSDGLNLDVKKYTSGTRFMTGDYIDNSPVLKQYISGTTSSDDNTILLEGISLLLESNVWVKRGDNSPQYHLATSSTLTNYDTSHASPVFLDKDTSKVQLWIKNTLYKGQPYYGFLVFTEVTYSTDV